MMNIPTTVLRGIGGRKLLIGSLLALSITLVLVGCPDNNANIPDPGAFTVGIRDQDGYMMGSESDPLMLPMVAQDGQFAYTLTIMGEGGLPMGLDFDPDTRELTGTPRVAGSYTLVYTATNMDSQETFTLTFQMTIREDRLPTFGTGPTRSAVDHQIYIVNEAIATLELPVADGGDGSPSYGLTIMGDESGLPMGLVFDPDTRKLTGTPETVGLYMMIYTATDTDDDTDSLRFAITVALNTAIVPDPTVAVTEGDDGTTEVTIPLSFFVDLQADVVVTPTVQTSSTAEATDYEALVEFTISAGTSSPFDYTITINNDDLLEGDETIVIQFSTASDETSFDDSANRTTVTIVEDDTITVTLDYNAFFRSRGFFREDDITGAIELSISGTILTAPLQIRTRGGPSTSPNIVQSADPVNVLNIFNPGSGQLDCTGMPLANGCSTLLDIALNDDNVALESEEFFTITTSTVGGQTGGEHGPPAPAPTSFEIEVRDDSNDENVVLSITPTTLTIMEGGTGTFNVRQNFTAVRNVPFELMISGTGENMATIVDDFEVSLTDGEFGAMGPRMIPVTVTVPDDGIPEGDETFSIGLVDLMDSDIALHATDNTITITIMDPEPAPPAP